MGNVSLLPGIPPLNVVQAGFTALLALGTALAAVATGLAVAATALPALGAALATDCCLYLDAGLAEDGAARVT